MKSRKLVCCFFVLFSTLLQVGCNQPDYQWFSPSKSEIFNISFEYPTEWSLSLDPYNENVTYELWLLTKADYKSSIEIVGWNTSSPEAAIQLKETFSRKLNDQIDYNDIDFDQIDICEHQTDLIRYHKPTQYEDDFIFEEMNIIRLSFINENVYYSFSAEILVSEDSIYDEFNLVFLEIINSIECK
jgi:hypothetical protein